MDEADGNGTGGWIAMDERLKTEWIKMRLLQSSRNKVRKI